MKIDKISVFLILCTIGFGCQKVECPAFPEKLHSWFTYPDNKIQFINDMDTINFKIISTDISEAWSYRNNCDCDCGASATFETNECELGYKIVFQCDYGTDKSISFFYQFVTPEKNGDNYFFDYNSISETFSHIDNLTTYTIGSVTFEKIAVIENTNNQLVKKVFVQKNKGLIGFIDFNGKEWKLFDYQ